MELRYKHVEVALAEVIGIGPNDMPAFRARLRHLRNIGVPRLPNPGSGQPIAYTRQQALELLALELETVGQAPKKVETTLQKEELVRLAKTIVRQSPYGKYKGKDCFAVVTESRPGVTLAFGVRPFLEFMKSAPPAFLVINVSACVRQLNPALDRALAT